MQITFSHVLAIFMVGPLPESLHEIRKLCLTLTLIIYVLNAVLFTITHFALSWIHRYEDR